MNPAFSVIFLTTLIGVGQGLFMALVAGQLYMSLDWVPLQSSNFFGTGSAIALLFLVAGLVASFFHLGRPERAWRAASQWRTSWLSREVIVLPILMGLVFVYAAIQFMGDEWVLNLWGLSVRFSLLVGLAGIVFSLLLFLCTGMIYACLKFLQEWHSPLTVINYLLLGTASGAVLGTAYAQLSAPGMVELFGVWAISITLLGFISRSWSLIRNARIKYKSSIQSAIGVHHKKIQQKSMGFMGGSVNTRDFFHHQAMTVLRNIKWITLLLVFALPLLLLFAGMAAESVFLLALAFIIQYLGLLFERWLFFAQANHPQNLYYQTV